MYHYALSVPSSRIPSDPWIQALRKSRLKRIEYSCAGNCLTPCANFAGKVRRLEELQRQGEITVSSIHIPFGGDWHFSVDNPDLQKMHLQRHLDFIRACLPLKVRNFTLHGGGEPVPPERRQQALDRLRRALDDFLPRIRNLDVSLNLELLPRSCLANTPQELLDIIGDYPPEQLGACLDVNHLCGTPERVPDAIRLLGDRIRTFHFSDYDGVDECHWYPFLGCLPWDRIMAEIRRLTQEVTIILETDGFLRTPTWQTNRKLLDSSVFHAAEHNVYLLENAERVAEGVRHLIVP